MEVRRASSRWWNDQPSGWRIRADPPSVAVAHGGSWPSRLKPSGWIGRAQPIAIAFDSNRPSAVLRLPDYFALRACHSIAALAIAGDLLARSPVRQTFRACCARAANGIDEFSTLRAIRGASRTRMAPTARTLIYFGCDCVCRGHQRCQSIRTKT
jgi:hypothetical protein